jgi:hypothetical protein
MGPRALFDENEQVRSLMMNSRDVGARASPLRQPEEDPMASAEDQEPALQHPRGSRSCLLGRSALTWFAGVLMVLGVFWYKGGKDASENDLEHRARGNQALGFPQQAPLRSLVLGSRSAIEAKQDADARVVDDSDDTVKKILHWDGWGREARGGQETAKELENASEEIAKWDGWGEAYNSSKDALTGASHWDGWGKVFPWMMTSTTTSTTLTTTSTQTTSTRTSTGTTTSTTRTTSTSTSTGTETATNTSITRTTTTACKSAEDGDECYKEVIKAMNGVRITTDDYKGITVWSTFEEVQQWLADGGSQQCFPPCECRTAKFGDECYQSVMWAYLHGMSQHPEWYGGLDKTSPFELVQKQVMQTEETCGAPCRPAFTAENTSLFCFTVTRPDGYEREVMEAQLNIGAGIFACDGFSVLSSQTFKVGAGPGDIGEVSTISVQTPIANTSKDNTLLFMHAWTIIRDKTNALDYEWTVKVDPDAVVLPDRLTKHLAPYAGFRGYVRNCNAVPESDQFPMMFGSLEAISREALTVYIDGGEQNCLQKLDWNSWGEDVFLGKCMDYLEVAPIDNFGIISDGVCEGVDCEDAVAGAFHPFKDVDHWMTCWNKATRRGQMSLQPLPKA